MTMSRFFCENLLSDYHEGLLPPGRRDEVEAKLSESSECKETYDGFQSSLECLKRLPLRQVPPEVALQVVEICEGRGRSSKPGYVRKWATAVLFLVAVASGVLAWNPSLRQRVPVLRNPAADKAHFVGYYPQAAQEILEEQAVWIQMRDALAANFWEEGGLTPPEFERSFQLAPQTPEK